MTLEELKEKLIFLTDNQAPISLSLYFVLENNGVLNIKFADVDDIVSIALLNQFNKYIESKLVLNESLLFRNVTEADDRKNAAYFYDLTEKPVGLQILSLVTNDEEQEHFDFANDDLNTIKAFLILIGNQNNKLCLYKKHYPINYLKRDSILRIFPSATRFEKIDKNILSLNDSFEFLEINGSLIILNLKVLEKYFGYEQIIRKAAVENLHLIENSQLLEDVTILNSLSNDLKYAKKIVKIKHNTPVLALPVSTVISFIQRHPILKKRIRLNSDNSKISLDTKVSQELFLKLLNDDFLKSELTTLLYDSQNKDNIVIEEENIE